MKPHINPVTYRLALLSGVRRAAILRAPDALNRAATTGVIMLLTAAFATFTMGYALQRAFIGDSYDTAVAVAGGLLWGAFILALDRLLLMGIDKTSGRSHTIGQLLIRAPIAILLGMVISKPLTLRVTRTVLDRELREERITAVGVDRRRAENTEDIGGKNKSVGALEQQRRQLEVRINSDPDSFEYKEATKAVEEAKTTHRRIGESNRRKIANAQQTINRLERSDQPNDAIRAQRLRNNIRSWWGEINRAARDIDAAERHVKEVAEAWVEVERAKLNRTIKDLAIATQRRDVAEKNIITVEIQSDKEHEELLRTNLVNEYTALEKIKNTPSHRNSETVKKVERGLDAIFILFELAPLLSKVFSRKNALDIAASAIEEEDENRISHAMNTAFAQSQKLFEIGLDLYDEAVDQYAARKSQAIQQNPITAVQDLRDLSDEIARLAA